MRTRSVPVPVLHFDDNDDTSDKVVAADTTLIGLPVSAVPVAVPRQVTQTLDHTLRQPAECRFFITSGFFAGAPTEVIAESIARGEEWIVGQLWGVSNWAMIVNLSDKDVPASKQMAAWRPVPAE
jgi:hypothetical protein